jgi:hypothetical protein
VRYNKITTSARRIDTGTKVCLNQGDVDSRDASTFDDACWFTAQTHLLPSGLTNRAFSPTFCCRDIYCGYPKGESIGYEAADTEFM